MLDDDHGKNGVHTDITLLREEIILLNKAVEHLIDICTEIRSCVFLLTDHVLYNSSNNNNEIECSKNEGNNKEDCEKWPALFH